MEGILLGAFSVDNMSDDFDRAIKSCTCKQSCDHQMMTFSNLYKKDIKMRQLRTQLKYLPSLLQPKANINNIKECFKKLREQATSDGKLISKL
jgi:hypothetical protein